MSDNDHDNQPVSKQNTVGLGFGCAALIGLVVAIAPLLFLDIRVSWAALYISIPLGIVVAVAGLIASVVGAASGSNNSGEPQTERTNLAEMMGESTIDPATKEGDNSHGR